MDLRTVVDVAQLAGTVTVIAGTVFGLMQLRQIKVQRQEAAAGELMRAFMGPEFAEAMAMVMSLPDGISGNDLRRASPSMEKSATLICTTFETIGVLVYEQITPFPLVMKLAGGILVVLWRKLQPWIDDIRIQQSNPSDSEWFQWLAEQCEKRMTAKIPAYIEHRDWSEP
jgi:hypothetical protein